MVAIAGHGDRLALEGGVGRVAHVVVGADVDELAGFDDAVEERGLLIGPRNCEPMTGLTWRYVVDHAEKWGVRPISVGGKRVIVAERLLAALEAKDLSTSSPSGTGDVDELDGMRERLRAAGKGS